VDRHAGRPDLRVEFRNWRAVAEVYASDDAGQKFAEDFALAWGKVMNADRF
jgi:catalase (peroxidase I)